MAVMPMPHWTLGEYLTAWQRDALAAVQSARAFSSTAPSLPPAPVETANENALGASVPSAAGSGQFPQHVKESL